MEIDLLLDELKPVTLKTLQKRAEKARDHAVTCAASRNLHLWADLLAAGTVPGLFHMEPKHCAKDMLTVIAELWELRRRRGGKSRGTRNAENTGQSSRLKRNS